MAEEPEDAMASAGAEKFEKMLFDISTFITGVGKVYHPEHLKVFSQTARKILQAVPENDESWAERQLIGMTADGAEALRAFLNHIDQISIRYARATVKRAEEKGFELPQDLVDMIENPRHWQ